MKTIMIGNGPKMFEFFTYIGVSEQKMPMAEKMKPKIMDHAIEDIIGYTFRCLVLIPILVLVLIS